MHLTLIAMIKHLSILIVDDNRNFVQRLVSMIREQHGPHLIQVAENYDEACRSMDDQMPDVALLDINLPGKNGMEILQRIRKNGDRCAVIMITNHADEYYREQCELMGATYFLDKTVEFARVPAILNEMRIQG